MRKASHLLCAMLSVLATGFFASPAVASGYADPEVPPTEEIVIEATAAGTGCVAGVAAVTMAPDNSSLTVDYPDFTAKIGVGALPNDYRKICVVGVTVHAPENVTFTVDSQDSTGYASIAPGASAQRRASSYFRGQPQPALMVNVLYGPFASEWTGTDNTPVASISWAPCGAAPRDLTLNSELRLMLGTSDYKTTTSLISMESTVYHLYWRPCPAVPGV